MLNVYIYMCYMRKLMILLAVVSVMNMGAMHAQEMRNGMGLLNIGVGLLPGVGFNISYDYGLVDTWGPGVFTVGGYVGYGNWGASYRAKPHYIDYRVNAFAFAPRATYRYAVARSFEVYGAAMLGAMMRFNSNAYYEHSNNKRSSGSVFSAVSVGCRYTFADNISVFGEMGYNDVSYLSGGLSFSF
jgi:hypothetical protein